MSTSTTTTTSSSKPKTILLLNGPNLNLLGHREPHIYGHTTLATTTNELTTLATSHNVRLQTFQSNHEGSLIDRIHTAFFANLDDTEAERVDAIIINPGAYTHTSVGIRDALTGTKIPFVEVHISNVHAREAFRHHSYLSDKAEAVIAGLGVYGYTAALEYWCWKWEGEKGRVR